LQCRLVTVKDNEHCDFGDKKEDRLIECTSLAIILLLSEIRLIDNTAVVRIDCSHITSI